MLPVIQNLQLTAIKATLSSPLFKQACIKSSTYTLYVASFVGLYLYSLNTRGSHQYSNYLYGT